MGTTILQLTYSLATIDVAVQQFWAAVQPYRVLAFSGEMGAGKTTFISHLCRYLQVEDAVSSPTFALVNEYHFPAADGADDMIYHIDLYRLKDHYEAINAGMEDCISIAAAGNARCLVEWPEKAPELFSKPYLWISIETVDPEVRNMTVTLVS